MNIADITEIVKSIFDLEIEMRIAKTVRNIVKLGGKESILTKQEREVAKTEAGKWKKKYEDSVKWNEIVGELMNKAEKMQNLKYGKFLSSTQYKSDLFKGSIEKLSRIKFRGNIKRFCDSNAKSAFLLKNV